MTAFVTWRPPLPLEARASSVVVAYGGPVIHNTTERRGAAQGRQGRPAHLGVDRRRPIRRRAEAVVRGDAGRGRRGPCAPACRTGLRGHRRAAALLGLLDPEFTRKDGLNAAVDGDAPTERVSAACDALVAAAGDRPLEIEATARVGAADQVLAPRRPAALDGRQRRPAPLAGSPHAGHLADVVIKALGDALTVQSGDARTTTSFVDTGVYTRDRCFRVWGSTKHGDDAGAAFDVTEQRVFPGSRPVAFTRSKLRETLVVPELQPGEIDCLEIDAPVEPPPPPPSPGAAEEAAAPAAPAMAAPGRPVGRRHRDAAADATALPHKFIIARAGDRGQPPALFAAVAAGSRRSGATTATTATPR